MHTVDCFCSFCRTLSGYCSACVSRVGLSTKQATEPYSDKVVNCTRNPAVRRALRQLLCYPDLPILAFFVFLAFFVLRFSLLSFPRISRVLLRGKSLLFRGILAFLPKKQGLKGQGSWVLNWESTENWDFHRLEPYTKPYHSPRIFYKSIPFPVFLLFFVVFTGIRCGTEFSFCCNSHALLGESRGYCTKTKQEWPDSRSTLENTFWNFYEINSSQGFFLYCKP